MNCARKSVRATDEQQKKKKMSAEYIKMRLSTQLFFASSVLFLALVFFFPIRGCLWLLYLLCTTLTQFANEYLPSSLPVWSLCCYRLFFFSRYFSWFYSFAHELYCTRIISFSFSFSRSSFSLVCFLDRWQSFVSDICVYIVYARRHESFDQLKNNFSIESFIFSSIFLFFLT